MRRTRSEGDATHVARQRALLDMFRVDAYGADVRHRYMQSLQRALAAAGVRHLPLAGTAASAWGLLKSAVARERATPLSRGALDDLADRVAWVPQRLYDRGRYSGWRLIGVLETELLGERAVAIVTDAWDARPDDEGTLVLVAMHLVGAPSPDDATLARAEFFAELECRSRLDAALLEHGLLGTEKARRLSLRQRLARWCWLQTIDYLPSAEAGPSRQ